MSSTQPVEHVSFDKPDEVREGTNWRLELVNLNRPGFGGGSLVESQATRLIRSPSSYRASNSAGGLPPQAP